MSDEIKCYLQEEDDPADHDLTRYGCVCGQCYKALSEEGWREAEALRQRIANIIEVDGSLQPKDIRNAAFWIVSPPQIEVPRPEQWEIDARIAQRTDEVERVEKIINLCLEKHFGELKAENAELKRWAITEETLLRENAAIREGLIRQETEKQALERRNANQRESNRLLALKHSKLQAELAVARESAQAVYEEWGIQWAMGTEEAGYFARVAYKDVNGKNFYKPLGEKIKISKEDFEKIEVKDGVYWHPAATMPEWAVRFHASPETFLALREELASVRQSGNAWDALMSGLTAISDLKLEGDETLDERLNAYLEVYQRQQKEIKALRAALETAKTFEAGLSEYCDGPERDALRWGLKVLE